ncbi:hypothetical protein D9615_004839 [Tricholomella constricta]|uniref:Uncharacterized protein n=1 Tax=Tricholomella constricta TaxID=117010 RepID=A0A8H5HH80_9AGAR|nr:hypothetical protein D9615_004839 [Tricholomella constricta]
MVAIRYRLGGWVMSEEEAFKWAARLDNKPVEEVTFDYAIMIILRHLKQRIEIALVYPNTPDEAMIMVVTQLYPYWQHSRRGEKLEQFQKGKAEELVRRILTHEGVQNIQFITAIGEL